MNEVWATSWDVIGYGVGFAFIGFPIGQYIEQVRRWK